MFSRMWWWVRFMDGFVVCQVWQFIGIVCCGLWGVVGDCGMGLCFDVWMQQVVQVDLLQQFCVYLVGYVVDYFGVVLCWVDVDVEWLVVVWCVDYVYDGCGYGLWIGIGWFQCGQFV